MYVVRLLTFKGIDAKIRADHTIPPYACAVVCILGMCFIADYYQNKAVFISLFAAIGTACFIVVCASTSNTVRCKSLIVPFLSIQLLTV